MSRFSPPPYPYRPLFLSLLYLCRKSVFCLTCLIFYSFTRHEPPRPSHPPPNASPSLSESQGFAFHNPIQTSTQQHTPYTALRAASHLDSRSVISFFTPLASGSTRNKTLSFVIRTRYTQILFQTKPCDNCDTAILALTPRLDSESYTPPIHDLIELVIHRLALLLSLGDMHRLFSRSFAFASPQAGFVRRFPLPVVRRNYPALPPLSRRRASNPVTLVFLLVRTAGLAAFCCV